MVFSPSQSLPTHTAVSFCAGAPRHRQQCQNQADSQGDILPHDTLDGYEQTKNSRIHWRVVRRHQPDKYGRARAVRSDSRRGRGPVDWRRHVFRRGACRHRNDPAQTPVGNGSRRIRKLSTREGYVARRLPALLLSSIIGSHSGEPAPPRSGNRARLALLEFDSQQRADAQRLGTAGLE